MTLFTILFFVFGLIVGSFLNVVIIRHNTSRSLGGRSGCMVCEKKLAWYELIPVFSFLFLKGRCKGCQTRISIQYPLVELVTGLIFSLLFVKFQTLFQINPQSFYLTFIFYAVAFSLLLVIAVYDLRHKIISDKLVLIFSIITFLGLFLFTAHGLPAQAGFLPHWPTLWQFGAGLLIALPFAFLWLVSKGAWMGLGDAKLAVGLGWLLGLAQGLSGLVLAFWTGAIVGVALLFLSKKYSMKSEIPFAPFLVLGAILAFFFSLNVFMLKI